MRFLQPSKHVDKVGLIVLFRHKYESNTLHTVYLTIMNATVNIFLQLNIVPFGIDTANNFYVEFIRDRKKSWFTPGET